MEMTVSLKLSHAQKNVTAIVMAILVCFSAPVFAQSDLEQQIETLQDELDRLKKELQAQQGDEATAPGVVGVNPADCDVGPCIQVTVTRRTQSMISRLPASIEGYPVVVSERASGH